ncbi:MAG: hypothetical protein RL748_2130 [Pseudomonadota bacterium]|jgi:hypothetical protein
MAKPRELDVSFLDWAARAVLAALTNEKDRLNSLVESSDDDDDDDDEVADAGNDLLEASGLLERMTVQAKAAFGDQITDFDSNTKFREPARIGFRQV